MDPPPLPPLPAAINQNYSDSVESSPRSHTAETFHEPLPPVPGAKLRLMCSYGGHIIPRPHDKSLCYVGGETRMIAIDRHSSLSCLASRLSSTLVSNRPFTLKYQLPNEELDSLVSVTTDEDLENMIEEYERVSASSSSALAPSRIRLFLFFNKPETAASMGSLIDDAKSETWFVDALNGSGLLPRNLSDSATMDCLVTLDNGPDLEANVVSVEGVGEGENKQGKDDLSPDLHTTLSDAPMVESNSFSSGSSSSSPSMCNLPPIRVRVEDQKVGGMEEQLAQMSFAQAVQRKQDDGYCISCAVQPPVPAAIGSVGKEWSSENLNKMVSDDDRSDHGVPIGFRKPPLPLQPVQQKVGTCYNMPSPDSVKSDSSIASANSLSKPIYFQDQTHGASRDSRAPASPGNTSDTSTQGSEMHIPQFQDSGYPQPSPLDQQQQYVPANTHYIPHPTTTPVPMQSYHPIYAQPSHQQPHPPIDQQYPVYVMPVPQSQPYMSMQANMADTTSVVASTRPVTPTPNVVATSAGYKDSHPPIYPTKVAATSAKPDMAANVYRTAVPLTPSLMQIPANHFQQQYVGYSQMQHPSQSIAMAPSSNANYGYQEYANGTHDRVYYAQHLAAPLPPQYQSITPAAAVALADASNQFPPNNTMQQMGTSQPL